MKSTSLPEKLKMKLFYYAILVEIKCIQTSKFISGRAEVYSGRTPAPFLQQPAVGVWVWGLGVVQGLRGWRSVFRVWGLGSRLPKPRFCYRLA